MTFDPEDYPLGLKDIVETADTPVLYEPGLIVAESDYVIVHGRSTMHRVSSRACGSPRCAFISEDCCPERSIPVERNAAAPG